MRAALLAAILICLPASAAVLSLVPTFIAGGGGGSLGQSFELTYGGGGLNTGYLELSYGSLSPDFLDSGIFGAAYTIRMLVTNSGGNLLAIEMSGTSRPQGVFSTITTSVGTYESSAATYYANYLSSGNTRWEWSVGSMFPGSGSETVILAP